MAMGSTCSRVLADMGAEVIKVEPVEGDRTRPLLTTGGLVWLAHRPSLCPISCFIARQKGQQFALKAVDLTLPLR
jgi:crotonobetainyl-CoA:carnitine CoA-transferase CaiB-like acyl-CoA transferase